NSLVIFTTTPTKHNYNLSLHDALPICKSQVPAQQGLGSTQNATSAPIKPERSTSKFSKSPHVAIRLGQGEAISFLPREAASTRLDRKSTRLNSSHRTISYAVFCLKKKI